VPRTFETRTGKPISSTPTLADLSTKRRSTSNDRRSHFTAAAPKAAAAGENQVSVAPLAHCETRLEGTLSPRFSRAHADAIVS